jgi:hypothetical protein
MKTVIKFTVAAMFALVCGWFLISQYMEAHKWERSQPGDNESYAHKIKRYRAGADAALPAAITNAVVGLRTILTQRTETYDDNFNKWTARAEVEFINPVGGVERTNLDFGSSPSGQMSWYKKQIQP